MDVSVYSPASLPNDGDTFVGQLGLVSGKQPLVKIRENPEVGTYKKSTFSKFDCTP